MIKKTKTGWQHVETIDLEMTGEYPGRCERCNRKDLRYLHVMEHADEGSMEVGCECAKRLCWGYDPEREVKRLQNLWKRRNRWLTRNWATSWKGNEYVKIKHEGEEIVVTILRDKQVPTMFRYSLGVDGEWYSFREKYPSADEAKLGAFDTLAEALDW